MAALVESKATALNKGNKKYSYITDFFDIQHVAGRGSFGTVFQALLRCEYDSRPRGTGSTASNLALKKISLSSGMGKLLLKKLMLFTRYVAIETL